MKRRTAATSGAQAVMPEHLSGPVYQRMAAFYDPSETVPDWWSPREPLSYYGTREKQEGRWREYSAWQRAQEARHAWLAEHGYVRPNGHVDWGRFNRDFNRPVFYGGPRPRPDGRQGDRVEPH